LKSIIIAGSGRNGKTEDEWTHTFDDDELIGLCKFLVEHNQEMYETYTKYGLTIYDTSGDREFVEIQNSKQERIA